MLSASGSAGSAGSAFGVLNVTFIVMTLNTTGGERARFIRQNRKVLPTLKTMRSVNGYDKGGTARALANTPLKYHLHTFCYATRFGTLGSLANFLTKYRALRVQIQSKLPFMAMLEDDMKLQPGFGDFVERAARKYLAQPSWRADGKQRDPPELLQLGPYGEGYVTSLESARRVVQELDRQGIPMTVDAMLNDGHAGRVMRIAGTPWAHHVQPNEGDCLRTAHIGQGDLPRRSLALPTCRSPAACLAEVDVTRRRYCRGATARAGRGAAHVNEVRGGGASAAARPELPWRSQRRRPTA